MNENVRLGLPHVILFYVSGALLVEVEFTEKNLKSGVNLLHKERNIAGHGSTCCCWDRSSLSLAPFYEFSSLVWFFYSREVSADQEVVRRRPHVQMEGHRPGSHPVRDAHHHEGHVMARRHRNGLPLRWRHQSRPHAW